MSDDFGLRGPKPPWTCPNDRQLALRAKLQTGWSIKTNTFNTYPKPPPLTEREQQIIVSVVKKAEELDLNEQHRVGKLVDRLESLKKLANGNGVTECILCGDSFGLSVFGRSNYKCHDCEKAVCRKCVVEIAPGKPGYMCPSPSGKETMLRLCKVCSENRELIKKSGAWFYKGVPKYILPEKKNHYTNSYEKYAASPRYQEQKYVSRYINNSNNDQEPTSSSKKGSGAADNSNNENSTTTTTATTTTTTTSTASTSRTGRPGGFFWSRSLQTRWGSSQQTSSTDPDNESSSGDEGTGTGHHLKASGASAGPKNSHASSNPSRSRQNSGSVSPGGATATSPSGTSNTGNSQNGKSGLSRGQSGHRLGFIGRNTATSSSTRSSRSRGTSPVPSTSNAANVDEFGAGSSLTPGTRSKHGSSSNVSREKSFERFDLVSRDAVVAEGDQPQGPSTTTATTTTNNGDNNAKSSGSSSNDLLFQNAMAHHSSTPSISATSSTTSAAASSSGGGPHAHHQQQGSSSSTSTTQFGSIQVALLYDDTHQALHCSVHHARDLIPSDINGLSDPYCILKLIPSRFEGTHLRTKTVHKSVNPIFNETLTFYGVTPHDLTWQSLQILVMDDDRWGKDCLGSVQIPLHRIRSQQTRCFAQSLERGRLSEEREWGRGRLLLSLTYLTEKSLLLVGVIQAQDLPALDHNGTSDPFVKVRLLHDTNLGALSTSCFSSSSINRKFRTSVKWRTLNPEFREEFSLKVSIVDLPRLALVISVWDKDLGKNDDYIGAIVLSSGSKGERLKHWMDMIKLPNTKHFKWHTLSPSGLPNH